MTASPGSHPHADQRNWQPSQTFEAYAANCKEGLEIFSWRRAAKLLRWSPAMMWRVKLLGEIPKPLFERLVESDDPPSLKQLAEIGRLFSDGNSSKADVERCPHCSGILRVRQAFSPQQRQIVAEWLAERRADGGS